MYPYEAIRQVHVELTDKCNAACPQCSRSDHGGPVNSKLPLTELSLSDIQTILPPQFVSQLTNLYACGNYGDPIVARDCLDIFRYLRTCNPGIKLGIHTNGGVRSTAFWEGLATLLPKGKGYVRFGIDGLEDTNHIYRRNVRWRVLMRNVTAFIEAGGNAEWDYLVFRHNEHQVEDAKRLADELGFTLFNVKKTRRFQDWKTLEYIDSTPVKDRNGEVVDRIERPLNPKYQNEALDGLRDLRTRYGSLDRCADLAEIQCKVQAKNEIYLSAEGLVLPCCWLAGQLHHRTAGVLDLLEPSGGIDQISSRRRSLGAIVGDQFFQKLVPQSWGKSSCAEGKMRTCARICGHEFKQYEAQSARKQPVATESKHPT